MRIGSLFDQNRAQPATFFVFLNYFTLKPMFYSSSIESEMKNFYNSLSQKDKRRVVP